MRARRGGRRRARLHEAGRGHPQAEHLLLDLPADPAGSLRATDAGRRRAPPLQRTSLHAEAAGDHVRAAARGSALVGGDHPRQRRQVAPGPTASARRCATRPSTTSTKTRVYLDYGGGRASTWTCSTGRSRARARAAGGRRRGPDRSARPPSWTRGSRRPASTTTRSSARPSIRCWATWARSPRAARIVPETRDGKPAGFRLFSVRPDGPFAKIGLQNGDVISAINGLEMTSPDKALRGLHEAQDGEPPLGRPRTQRAEDHQGLQHPMKRRTQESCRGGGCDPSGREPAARGGGDRARRQAGPGASRANRLRRRRARRRLRRPVRRDAPDAGPSPGCSAATPGRRSDAARAAAPTTPAGTPSATPHGPRRPAGRPASPARTS